MHDTLEYWHPGKKLMFMGNELGQWRERNHDTGLDCDVLHFPLHSGLQRWVPDLNTLYRGAPALHELDCDTAGFEWIDCNDSQRSIVSFVRRCSWREALNSDASIYGGSGQGNYGNAEAAPFSVHGRPFSLNVTLPPLGVLVFRSGPQP